MTISKWLSVALAASFLLFAFVSGKGTIDFCWHAFAGVLVLVASFGLFAKGWIGGGDAKFAAATALWFSLEHLVDYLIIVSIFGGILTLLLLQLRQYPLPI